MTDALTAAAKAVLDKLAELDEGHSRMRHIWRDVAALVVTRADFDDASPGERRDLERWDDTAPLANWLSASSIHASAMPQNSNWFTLADEDEGYNVPRAHRVFFEQAADYLHPLLAQPQRSFYTATHEAIQETVGFGTGPVYFGDAADFGPWFRSIPLTQSRIGENERGVVDTFYRVWKRPVARIAQHFGKERIGPKALAMLDAGSKEQLTLIHAVEPRAGGVKWAFAGKKPFRSIYMIKEHGHIISESGYDHFPYGVPRYSKRSGEVYGWGLGCENLADIKFLNELALRLIQATQIAIAPPMWVPGEGLLSELSLAPWAQNYYEGDRPGQEAPRALDLGSRELPISLEILKAKQDAIRRHFAVDWMDNQSREMTRLQFQLNRDDRMKVQSPMLGRMTAELCGPAINRTFEICWQRRMLPQPPADLLKRGVKLHVGYQSPLTRLQRYGEIEAIMASTEYAIGLANVDRSVLFKLDVAKALEAVVDRNGTPQSIMRAEEEVAELQKRADEQAQQLAQAQTMQAGAAAARDAAHAASMAQPPGQASQPRMRAVA